MLRHEQRHRRQFTIRRGVATAATLTVLAGAAGMVALTGPWGSGGTSASGASGVNLDNAGLALAPHRAPNYSRTWTRHPHRTSTSTTTTSPSSSPAPSPSSSSSSSTTSSSTPSSTSTSQTSLSTWPSASNTGVPAGTALTTYTGPCTITAANTTIDAKTVNCDLVIHAAGVKISRSKINGFVSSGDDETLPYSFTLSDSTVDASPGTARQVTAVGEANFTVLRSNIQGGNREVHCIHCTIQDSYVHGQDADQSGVWHESGIRMDQNGTIRHNTIACDAPNIGDAGCSAPLTGYGDFAPVINNVIDNNYFVTTPGGFCAYGGSSGGKPYSSGAHDIRFTNNVFEHGPTGNCGIWDAVTDFNPSAPGNVFTNNKFTDGTVIQP